MVSLFPAGEPASFRGPAIWPASTGRG
jgi:hypothetical protein